MSAPCRPSLGLGKSDHHLVVVLGPEKVCIVVRDERKVELLGQALQEWIDPLLLGDVSLDLDEEPWFAVLVRTEGRGVPAGLLDREIPVNAIVGSSVVGEVMRDRGPQVTVDRDEPSICLLYTSDAADEV